jgi:hypothetical protein
MFLMQRRDFLEIAGVAAASNSLAGQQMQMQVVERAGGLADKIPRYCANQPRGTVSPKSSGKA